MVTGVMHDMETFLHVVLQSLDVQIINDSHHPFAERHLDPHVLIRLLEAVAQACKRLVHLAASMERLYEPVRGRGTRTCSVICFDHLLRVPHAMCAACCQHTILCIPIKATPQLLQAVATSRAHRC